MQNIEKTLKSILNKEIDIVELVKEHIHLAEESHSKHNTFITILKEKALSRAKELKEKLDSGKPAGKLFGIPFTVKDLYMVEDTKTTFASKLMEDFEASYTSTVVQKCLDEGAILIGKTNCDPWGFGSTGENSGFGPTKNPLNEEYVAGGSSSGSASSLAFGVGFFSLGTDTGGSVRLPASYTGLYSIKPGYGSNSRYGIGAMGSSFDTPGFFTRNLEDLILLQKIMQGVDSNDATTFVQSDFYLDILDQLENNKEEKFKIGIAKEFFSEGLEEEIKNKVLEKISSLEKMGHTIVNVSIPTIKYALAAYYILVPSEIASNRSKYDGVRFGKKVSEEYEENLVESRSKFLESEVKRRIIIGTYVLNEGFETGFYKMASKVRTKLKLEFDEVFKKVDLLVSPISPSIPPKLGENTNDPLKNYLLDAYSVTANLVGIPAVAIPLSVEPTRMPIGIQYMFQQKI